MFYFPYLWTVIQEIENPTFCAFYVFFSSLSFLNKWTFKWLENNSKNKNLEEAKYRIESNEYIWEENTKKNFEKENME